MPEASGFKSDLALAWEISHSFTHQSFDLSARKIKKKPGWPRLPEAIFVRGLRNQGLSATSARAFVTLLAAMDRARDADRLWLESAPRLLETAPWATIPQEVVTRSLTDLGDALRQSGVSQRHLADSAAWRRIAESLVANPASPVTRAVVAGRGTARQILAALDARTAGGSHCWPFLRGPKVGHMWLRMMVVPGEAHITGMESVSVAVDVQVRRVTENLGVTATRGRPLNDVRDLIAAAWRERAIADGVDGPHPLKNTCAALDPALWMYGRVGCTACEKVGYQLPLTIACGLCGLPKARTPDRIGSRSRPEP